MSSSSIAVPDLADELDLALRLADAADAKALWQHRGGKSGGPGEVRLHVPIRDGHSTTGEGHTGSQHSSHEK